MSITNVNPQLLANASGKFVPWTQSWRNNSLQLGFNFTPSFFNNGFPECRSVFIDNTQNFSDLLLSDNNTGLQYRIAACRVACYPIITVTNPSFTLTQLSSPNNNTMSTYISFNSYTVDTFQAGDFAFNNGANGGGNAYAGTQPYRRLAGLLVN